MITAKEREEINVRRQAQRIAREKQRIARENLKLEKELEKARLDKATQDKALRELDKIQRKQLREGRRIATRAMEQRLKSGLLGAGKAAGTVGILGFIGLGAISGALSKLLKNE